VICSTLPALSLWSGGAALGHGMNTMCPACGISLVPESRFCHACGARIRDRTSAPQRFASPLNYTPQHLAQRILTSRGALEGEHKRVTVLFCDIVDSTSLAEALGEERMYEFLNHFFEHALEEVHHYEGSVNQFLGDGFMALFGAPLALEHHERHAVLAALGIRRRLAALRDDGRTFGDTPFDVRMGLNSGLVVVGKIGDNLRMDYTAVGDTTHVAARLQAMAAPGEVLIAGTTFERSRSVADARPLGATPIKGRSGLLDVYALLGQRSAGEVAEPAARTPSRFVDREREMAVLMDCLEQAEAGSGQAIGIVSEPGMGKTRLLQEFRQRIAQRQVGYLEGQCLSYGAAIPYLPILDIVRAGCRISDRDSADIARDKVRAAVEAVGLDPPAVLPYLLHVLGLAQSPAALAGITPETIQLRTFEALRQLCLKGSHRRPQVIVVEDLHWADRTTEDFLSVMVDSLAGAPVMLIATYRPGHSPAWFNKSFATQIALRPLPASSGLAIVQDLLASKASMQELARDIVARAEGNPLFLEELAHAVGERHSAVDSVPDTLLGVLGTRIDRLPDKAKSLLQTASVIGREFSRSLLAGVWQDDATLDTELARLVRLEFIHERATTGEPTYVFKHALTREAAYGGLLSRRRRACHGAVGRALEKLHAGRIDEAVEFLAHQFNLSDDDDKAVEYAIHAAGRAQGRWANAEALAFGELALQRLEAMAPSDANRLRRIDVVLKQAEVRFALGQHAAQLDALAHIETELLPSDEPARRAAWHYWTGFLNSLTGGRAETSLHHCQQASSIAQTAHLEDLSASADSCLAQVYVFAGELARAIGTGERALQVFERRGNRWWACRTLSHLSAAANASGQWQRGLVYCARALEHGVAMDDLRLKVSATIRFASTQIQRGDWQSGLAHCERAQALAPVQYDAVALRAIRGYGLIKAGRAAEGVAELTQALAFYDQAHLRYTQAQFTTWLAEGLLHERLADQALPLLQGLLGRCAELGYRHLAGVTQRLLAECLRHTDPAAAAGHLRSAIDILEAVDARSELAKAWLLAASFANDLVEASRAAEVRARWVETLRALGTVVE